MSKWFLLYLVFCHAYLIAQDSTRVLDEVQIQAYRYNRSLLDVPVSVALINEGEFHRFNNASLLPAVNTIPGVRMEERSPGSYRFSVRGSLVRSPFGVRNVKMYWNSLPFTDGGGNTYLNLIDLSTLGSMEIIKGPGGSLYGAGTGGVVLFKTKNITENALELSSLFGSYGLQRYQARGEVAGKLVRGSLSYVHQESDGFREQTALRRDVINTDWTVMLDPRSFLSLTIFFTDVLYETPGGLTRQEFLANPKQARPPAGPNRGAVEQKASVRNMSSFAGLNLDHDWSDKWSSRLGVFASYSDFENYSIRNVENRFETNIGSRMENQYSFGTEDLGGKVTFGGEVQLFVSPFHVSENNFGEIGVKTFSDDLTSLQGLLFLQSEFFLPYDFSLTVGASLHELKYRLERVYPDPDDRTRNFNSVFSPRIAALKKINNNLSVYGSISKGFSPPTLAEVRPSTEAFNNTLQSESGINYELGLRGGLKSLNFDITFYDFNLKNTIVLQRVEDGAEFFVNAGETDQKGIEASVTWTPAKFLKIRSAYNYNHYRFNEYVKDGTDFSGKKLTGVPPTVATLGIDVNLVNGLYFNFTGFYTDHVPLNDANAAFAEEYLLVNFRTGYTFGQKDKRLYEVFAGVNNVFDTTFSLGNDLNAFGGRFYNAAPGINYFAGLKFRNIFTK